MEGYFSGEFAHSLDEKGRLAIPAKFRGRFKEGAVVTRWLGECLAVWPAPEWASVNADIAKRPRTDPAATRFRHFLLAGAHEGDPDAQGRLTYNLQSANGQLITSPLQTSATIASIISQPSDVYIMMLSFRYTFQ